MSKKNSISKINPIKRLVEKSTSPEYIVVWEIITNIQIASLIIINGVNKNPVFDFVLLKNNIPFAITSVKDKENANLQGKLWMGKKNKPKINKRGFKKESVKCRKLAL